MTRYVDKPHGLTVASGNVFYFNRGNDFLEFNSMLRFEEYELGDGPYNSVCLDIETPASQLCWTKAIVPLPTTDNKEYTTYYLLKPWFRAWLDETIVGWEVRPPDARTMSEKLIFLPRRRDALAIAAHVKSLLGDIPSRIKPPKSKS